MKILVTGSNGFVGKNLVWNLREIQGGKNKTRPDISIDDIMEYDTDTPFSELESACKEADFVFHFAGVNRPQNKEEFKKQNSCFTNSLLGLLKKSNNMCPIMLASSIQACLEGRYANSEYGLSKLDAEKAVFEYAEEVGSKVYVYRFPNLFGKWCRPNYNSVVATFCNAIANDREYIVNDKNTELELLYIDDLIEGMLDVLVGKERRCNYDGTIPVESELGKYCFVPRTHKVTLSHIVELLQKFKNASHSIHVPSLPNDSFEKKLYSTFLTYLPKEDWSHRLDMKTDDRGSFTELIKTKASGQVSVNITKPGITKGEHWHNSKNEIFIVVSGHGLIRERKIGTNPENGKEYPIIEFEVSGEQMQAIKMIPGYTHSITNLSDTEELITVMWANEQFETNKPDTFYEPL